MSIEVKKESRDPTLLMRKNIAPRISSLDLLRIVAMGMIISMHYLGHGGIERTGMEYSSYFWSWLIKGFISVGVNCYVLISGYFLIRSASFSFRKVCKLWGTIFVYSVGFYLLFFLMGDTTWSWKEFIKTVFPVKGNAYWFATMYIGLYLLHPYLNRMIIGLDQTDARKLLYCLIFLFSIYSFLGDTYQAHSGFSVVWFIVVYLIGAYIRLFEIAGMKMPICVYMTMCVSMFVSFIVLLKGLSVVGGDYQILSTLYKYNSPINLLASVSLFLVFVRIKISSGYLCKWIQFFAPLTFGIYLIHDNILVREHLWHQWLRTQDYYDSEYFFLHWLVSVIGIFFVCALIEWGRKKITAFL